MSGWRIRILVLATLAPLLTAFPMAAQTPQGSGVAVAEHDPAAGAGSHPDFSDHAFRLFLASHPGFLEPVRIIDLSYDRAVRLALWNDPMSRLFYTMAAEDAMNGRTGLVNGGRALGAGLALTALGGAGSPLSAYVETLMPSNGPSHVSVGLRPASSPVAQPLSGAPPGETPQ